MVCGASEQISVQQRTCTCNEPRKSVLYLNAAIACAALAIWRWCPFLISPSQIQSMYVYSIEMYNKEYLNLKIQVNMYLETKDTERFNLIHQDMKSIISDFNRYERDNICKHRYDSMHVSNILTQLLPYLNKQDVICSMSSLYRHEYERR